MRSEPTTAAERDQANPQAGREASAALWKQAGITNPVGASGMLRFAEAALQVRGRAGEHQVDGARLALGHAYGGGSQLLSMWVVGADKPAS